MVDLQKANETLHTFHSIVNTKKHLPFDKNDELKVGVDLGTSSIVLAVTTSDDVPVYGSFRYAEVVRDGLVVNYIEAVNIVTELVNEATEVLGVPLERAATAVPPGTTGNDWKVVGNVLESAGLTLTHVIDEPTAAAVFLEMEEGGVVDVGGGTTGISIIKDYQSEITIDEPTGGTHMTLVLAGYNNIPVAEAELLKRDQTKQKQNFMVIKPVVDKMANITKRFLEEHPANPLFVVGGASYFDDFVPAFSKYIGQDILKPDYPQFVTPLGIAKCSTDDYEAL